MALTLMARRTGRPVSYFVSTRPTVTRAVDLASELSTMAARIRRFIAVNPQKPTEREAMKLVEMSTKQAWLSPGACKAEQLGSPQARATRCSESDESSCQATTSRMTSRYLAK